jgi:hypothetical protein
MNGNPDYTVYRAYVVKSLICFFRPLTAVLLNRVVQKDTPEYLLLIRRVDLGS